MRIIIDKISSDGSSEKMVVEISDKMLLRLGKRYFELAAESVGEKYCELVAEEVDSDDRTT